MSTTPPPSIATVKPSVREAYRQVLRYIHGRRLGGGDRLPPQASFRKSLNLGNDTLGEAMQLLVTDGVLTRQRKTGTVVDDPARATQAVWTVAITQSDHEGIGFSGILEYHLRKHLGQQGCEDRTFFRRVTPQDRPHRLEDFSGLAEAVQAAQIDVVMTQEHLLTSKVLVYHMSGGPDVKFGMELD